MLFSDVLGLLNGVISVGDKAANTLRNNSTDIGYLKDIFRNPSYSNSIKNASDDLIAQYPVLFTDDISRDNISLVIKALENEYVNMLVLILNNNSIGSNLNINDPNYTANFLRKYHMNINLNNESYQESLKDIENTYIKKNKELLIPFKEYYIIPPINKVTYNSVTNTLLNEASTDTQSIEQLNELIKNIQNELALYNQQLTYSVNKLNELKASGKATSAEIDEQNRAIHRINDMISNLLRQLDILEKRRNSLLSIKPPASYSQNATVTAYDVKKLNDLAPTIINIDIQIPLPNNTTVPKKITFGVKCVSHLLKTTDAEYYIPQVSLKKNPLMRLVQWTTGEIKFLKDLILCTDENKTDAMNTANTKGYWWVKLKSLSRLSKSNVHLRYLAMKDKIDFKNMNFIPTTTIVLSKACVDRIKEKSGINILKNDKFAYKICESLFLLSFMVIDESIEVAYIFNEKLRQWESYSFSSLDRAKKKIDAKDIFSLLK